MPLTTCPHCHMRVLVADDGTCPSCRRALPGARPQPAGGTTVATAKPCPACGAALSPTAVLCIDCGYDTRTGAHLARATEIPEDRVEVSDNPYHSPRVVEEREPDEIPWWYRWFHPFLLQGRVTRRYWWAVHLWFFLMECGFAALEVTGVSLGYWENVLVVPILVFYWVLYATSVKRWHDINRSAWWMPVNLVPIAGPLYALVELGFEAGTVGANDYGDDPRPGREERTLSV